MLADSDPFYSNLTLGGVKVQWTGLRRKWPRSNVEQFGGRKGVASMVAVSRRSQSDLEREQTGMKQFYLNRIDGGESSA